MDWRDLLSDAARAIEEEANRRRRGQQRLSIRNPPLPIALFACR